MSVHPLYISGILSINVTVASTVHLSRDRDEEEEEIYSFLGTFYQVIDKRICPLSLSSSANL